MTMSWNIVMAGVMDHCYDGVMEHCDEKGKEHCDFNIYGALR